MLKPNLKPWDSLEKSGKKRWFIAEKCGLTSKQLSQILRGLRQPTADQKKKISMELGVPTCQLFGGEIEQD